MSNREQPIALVIIPIAFIISLLVAIAGGSGGSKVIGIPVMVFAVILIYVIQWLVFIPSYRFSTEKYFDFTGSMTYIFIITLSFLLSSDVGLTATILVVIVDIWALRLGLFLFQRIRKAGKDTRFDAIKTSLVRFLNTWTLQGLWISLTTAAALAAITSTGKHNLGAIGILGLIVWIVGFGIEVLADYQKTQFKANPANKGKFIQSGIWAWSRHPNYFGEIVLWIGVAIIALPVLQGWQFVTLISPLFVILLLTQVSGIPLLEKQADERWGGQDDYEQYKANTSVLIPRPSK